jgi:hypothetical protein
MRLRSHKHRATGHAMSRMAIDATTREGLGSNRTALPDRLYRDAHTSNDFILADFMFDEAGDLLEHLAASRGPPN